MVAATTVRPLGGRSRETLRLKWVRSTKPAGMPSGGYPTCTMNSHRRLLRFFFIMVVVHALLSSVSRTSLEEDDDVEHRMATMYLPIAFLCVSFLWTAANALLHGMIMRTLEMTPSDRRVLLPRYLLFLLRLCLFFYCRLLGVRVV